MKKTLFLLAATIVISAPALADQTLATNKNCMSCHTVSNKVIGPSFKEIATKYAGQKDAVEKLSTKVLKGGSGVWGVVRMPANEQVTPEEARKLVTWILSLK